MLYADYFEEARLLYIQGREPFSLDEIIELAQKDARSGRAAEGRIIFMDLCRVRVTGLKEADIRRFIMKRLTLKDQVPSPPMAVLVRDLAGFGMVRMFAIMAEMSDLREEMSMYPSMDMDDAVNWTVTQVGFVGRDRLRNWLDAAAARAEAALG